MEASILPLVLLCVFTSIAALVIVSLLIISSQKRSRGKKDRDCFLKALETGHKSEEAVVHIPPSTGADDNLKVV